MTEIDFALNQDKDTDKIELVGTVLWSKAKEKGHFTKLSEAEQTFVYIDIFESEINNDSLFSFFYNISGEYAHQVLQAYQTIKAHETASTIAEAICVFKTLPVAEDILMRRSQINVLTQIDLDTWSELEFELIQCKDNVIMLLIEYIAAHKTDFEY